MPIKVMLNSHMTGLSYTRVKTLGDEVAIYKVEIEVADQFGDRPIFIADKSKIDGARYPKMYAAGWFVSDKNIDDSISGSELVVVAHGETMKIANSNMMKAVVNVEWEKYARRL